MVTPVSAAAGAAPTGRRGGGDRRRRLHERRGRGRRHARARRRDRRLQRQPHLAHVREARVGLLGQRAQDDLVDRVGQVGVALLGRHHRAARVTHHDLERVADERQPAGEHLVADHAQRVDVAAVVEPRIGEALLGRHVGRRADRRSRARQVRRLGRRAHQLHHAEVEHLHEVGIVGVVGQEDVLGLEIAVHDPLLVDRADRRRDLAQDAHGGALVERPLHLEAGAQRLALEHLHDDVVDRVRLSEVGDVDDVRMAD